MGFLAADVEDFFAETVSDFFAGAVAVVEAGAGFFARLGAFFARFGADFFAALTERVVLTGPALAPIALTEVVFATAGRSACADLPLLERADFNVISPFAEARMGRAFVNAEIA